MKIEKVEKLVANLHDKTEYVIHIRNSKQAINHGLALKTVHRVIKFNQNTWRKLYIAINTDLEKKKKMILQKTLLSWWSMQSFKKLWKMWENIEMLNLSQQKEEVPIWCQNQIIILQSFSQKKKLAIEMKKTETLMNKPVSLGHSTVELRKILMYEFWYDYAKPKYGGKAK